MDPLNMQNVSYQPMELEKRIENLSRREGGKKIASEGSSEVKKACADMESLFIFYLLKEMRATVPKTGYLDGGKSEEIYTSMLDARLSKELAAERGIGLAPMLYENLSGGTEKKR